MIKALSQNPIIWDNFSKFKTGIWLLFRRSVVSDSATPWTAAHQTPLPFTASWSLCTSLESVMLSNHLFLCSPPFLLPSIFPSVAVFSRELALHSRWPKYWASASASVLPMNIQGWSPLGLTGLTSLLRGLSGVFSSTTAGKHQFFGAQFSL